MLFRNTVPLHWSCFTLSVRFGNSLFRSSIFRSKSLILKIDHERFAHVALYKEQPWTNHEQFTHIALYRRANCSRHSLKKSDVSDLLVILSNSLQKTSDSLEKFVFLYVFDSFSHFLSSRAIHSGCSLLIADALFFKERLEQFTPIALYTRVTMINSLRSLMTKERRELFALFHERIALVLQKPISEFPTLLKHITGYR